MYSGKKSEPWEHSAHVLQFSEILVYSHIEKVYLRRYNVVPFYKLFGRLLQLFEDF